MIGKMAIVIALFEFNDLGCSATPTFLFRNRFYYNYPHYPKMNKKSMWEVKKKFQVFWPPDVKSCHLAAARRRKLWSLNVNLFFNPLTAE